MVSIKRNGVELSELGRKVSELRPARDMSAERIEELRLKAISDTDGRLTRAGWDALKGRIRARVSGKGASQIELVETILGDVEQALNFTETLPPEFGELFDVDGEDECSG